MFTISLLLAAAAGTHAAAISYSISNTTNPNTTNATNTNLYVASYSGNVTSLSLTSSSASQSLDLSVIYTSQICGGSPSWLTFDAPNRILYCLDEGNATPNGSVSSSKAAEDGQLTQIAKLDTISGPVSSVLYGGTANGSSSALFLAHYAGSAISTFPVTSSGQLTPGTSQTFTLPSPGPVAGRQAAPHEHQALLDPSGQYILVPDLGADLVRVFCFDQTNTAQVYEHEPLKVRPGSGPRHAAFWITGGGEQGGSGNGTETETGNTYLYVVGELDNSLTGYAVSYLDEGGLGFEEVARTDTFGGEAVPEGAAAAEVVVSPDSNFLIVSNRNDSSFSLPNYDPNNSTAELSDSLATFRINDDASLNFTQLWPAGGRYPRHFSLNEAGDKVAVGLQLSERVVVLGRDVETGELKEPVADIPVGGQITCVVWDE